MTVTALMVGQTLYLDAPQLAPDLGGKPWARLDLTSASSAADQAFAALSSLAQDTDPLTAIHELLATGDLAEDGADQQIDGVAATHYRGKILVDSELSGSQAQQYLTADQIKQLQTLATAQGMTGATVDLWVGPNGLPVRSEIGIASTQGDDFIELDYTGWGTAAPVTAPPADQVANVDSLLPSPTPTN